MRVAEGGGCTLGKAAQGGILVLAPVQALPSLWALPKKAQLALLQEVPAADVCVHGSTAAR